MYKSRNHQHKQYCTCSQAGALRLLGWEAVSLAAQCSSLSADSACFAKDVLSWVSCVPAVQPPHAQQSQVEPGWMATSTLRPIHYFWPASQPSPSCNDMLCVCKSLIKQGSEGQLTYLPLPIQMSTANHDIGNKVGNAKAVQAALNHLDDLRGPRAHACWHSMLHVPCSCSQAGKPITSTIGSCSDALCKQCRHLKHARVQHAPLVLPASQSATADQGFSTV